MRTKLFSLLLLLLILTPYAVNAEAEDEGKLKIQIDRIGEGEKGSNSVETELDKRFPELFKPETEKTIKRHQKQKESDIRSLQDKLFEESGRFDNNQDKLTEQLFSADYTAPERKSEEETDREGPFSILIIAALGVFGAAMIALLFWTFRKIA
ncbi:type VII secretion protein EssA [Aciduricibacillus chroicocephali]|uniref:Type VII secretion protein EssA n=1 Tax=Aciduricibacillus chroicocephali TaxID=3054939 RepID=A0ABY9KTZ7_9BACI|nr:type VII secretion protein EssA [Bacillaceae bacterium 44XB]